MTAIAALLASEFFKLIFHYVVNYHAFGVVRYLIVTIFKFTAECMNEWRNWSIIIVDMDKTIRGFFLTHTVSVVTAGVLTRKPCYRKENRAMRPIYMDAVKNFGSPWLRRRLLYPKLLTGFCCNRSY